MGGVTFSQEHYGITDPSEAFREATSQARYEYGHGGYSGTLAEKGEYTIIQKQPMVLEAAEKLAYALIDANDPRITDKWGPAGAIPLCNETPGEVEDLGRVTVEVTFKGVPSHEEVMTAAEAKVRKEHGKNVNCRFYDSQVTYEYRHTTTATKGATETRYFVMKVGDREMPSWESGYVSQAEARAHAAEAVARDRWSVGDMEAEIISMTRRSEGTPLATYQRKVKTSTHTVSLLAQRVVKPAQSTPGVAGWLFFGWASS